MKDGSGCDKSNSSLEVKKEFRVPETNKSLTVKECVTIDDSVFDTIPFMAKLLSNLRCSFYSEAEEIYIAGIDLGTLRELFDRLEQHHITANHLECGANNLFSLAISSSQITIAQTPANPPADTNESMRLLPILGSALCGQQVTVHLQSCSSLSIHSLSRQSLLALSRHLQTVRILPARIISSRQSRLFSISFSPQSLPAEGRAILKIRRPRATPNYLRDYVVDQEEKLPQETPAALSLFPSLKTEDDAQENKVVRGRGRPRIKPRPTEWMPKRPRGRPRRTDFMAEHLEPIADLSANSFINIQPRALNFEDIRDRFAQFLESHDFTRKSLP